jgi:hypothetical protein
MLAKTSKRSAPMSIQSTGLSRDEARVVSPKRAQTMLDVGATNFYGEILPQLESFKLGKSRKVTVASIERFIAKKLAEARGEAA